MEDDASGLDFTSKRMMDEEELFDLCTLRSSPYSWSNDIYSDGSSFRLPLERSLSLEEFPSGLSKFDSFVPVSSIQEKSKEVDDELFFKGATQTQVLMDDLRHKTTKSDYDRRKRLELKAYVHAKDGAKNSRLKCRCKVEGKELEGRLVIMGDEKAKKPAPPYYRLTKESDGMEGWVGYSVELVSKTGVIRERNAEEDVNEPQKKARGSTTQDLLEELELQVKGTGDREWHIVLPLLRKIVAGNGKGDTAYWHDVGNNERLLEERDIVGLVDGCISLDLSNASVTSVVAFDDWVAEPRNPRNISHDDAELVVYMGRSQVKVRPFKLVDESGPLYVVPDGCNNGVGIVLAVEEINGRPIVGLFAGHYEQLHEEYAVVDVIIFPSNDQRVLLEQLQTLRGELEQLSMRVDSVEERVHIGEERVDVVESRLDAYAADINGVESIVCEVANVSMETRNEVTGLQDRMFLVEKTQTECNHDRAIFEMELQERLAILERQMSELPALLQSLAVEERDVITSLRQMYLCLKIENVLDELSMKFSDSIYIEPHLCMPDGRSLSAACFWERIPKREGPVLILGDKGIGKSAFVRHECVQWAKCESGLFSDYDYVFYVDLSAVFNQGSVSHWNEQFPVSLESVLSLYFQAMRVRYDCFSTMPNAELLRKIRLSNRCCFVFDSFDYVESFDVAQVKDFLLQLRVGKIQGLDYMLLCSTMIVNDKFQPRAEVRICGFEEKDVPKFLAAVAETAPEWKLDVKAMTNLVRTNISLAELSKTPLFLLLCCIASKDLLQQDPYRKLAVADIFNFALGRLIADIPDRKQSVDMFYMMSLRWFRGEKLITDDMNLHQTGLAQSGILCTSDWRLPKVATGCVKRDFHWVHGCIASFYFAKYILDVLLESNFEEAKTLLLSRFDFFVWRIMFGLSRDNNNSRVKLIRLWLEHHTHLIDHLFERGLFRLPEFEGIELLLWNSGDRKSIQVRRALTSWFIMKELEKKKKSNNKEESRRR